MKNLSFDFGSDINGSYLSLVLDPSDVFDEISYMVVQEDCPDFLLPFKRSVSNGRVQLNYQQKINWTSLKYSISSSMTKKEFVQHISALISPLVHGADWFLEATNFLLDLEYVFIDKTNESLHFVYIPTKDAVVTPEEAVKFIRDVSFDIEITDDPKFQISWMRLFENPNLNIAILKNFLDNEIKLDAQAKKPVKSSVSQATPQMRQSQPVPAQQATPQMGQPQAAPAQQVTPQMRQSQPAPAQQATPQMRQPQPVKAQQATPQMRQQQQVPAQQVAPQQNNSKDVYNELFGDDKADKKKKKEKTPAVKEKKGLFGKKKREPAPIPPVIPAPAQQPMSQVRPQMPQQPMAQPMQQPQQPIQQPVQHVAQQIQSAPVSNDTVIFDDAIPSQSNFLQLVSSPIDGAPERISLDFEKPFISIGRVARDTVDPDVAFSSAFKGIGRKHAIIENAGGVFYLIDQGSSNKTLINGQELIPNKKYQLNNGDMISFTIAMPVKYKVCIN